MPDDSYIYKEGTTPATVVNHDEAVDQINSRLLAADTVMVSERKIMADGEQVGLVQSMEIVLTNGGGSDVVKFKVGQPDGKQVEVVRGPLKLFEFQRRYAGDLRPCLRPAYRYDRYDGSDIAYHQR